jgi:hypothetical protein
MAARVWTKPDTQGFIKRLRDAGYVVNKISGGYECTHEGKQVFRALEGPGKYLIRYDEKIFPTKEAASASSS